MFNDMLGKLNDAVPEDLKTQFKEKINQEVSEQLEGAKKRFFGEETAQVSEQTAAAPETTEAVETENTETVEASTEDANSDSAEETETVEASAEDTNADSSGDQEESSKEVA